MSTMMWIWNAQENVLAVSSEPPSGAKVVRQLLKTLYVVVLVLSLWLDVRTSSQWAMPKGCGSP